MSEEREEKFSEEHPIATIILMIVIISIVIGFFNSCSNQDQKQKISFCEDASRSALTMKQSKDIGIPYDSQLNVIKIVGKNDGESKISYYKHILDITYENKDTDDVKFGLIVKDMCLTENWRM